MRAMILAAGRGGRMRELTLHTPKPLLRLAGKYLIEYAILQLQAAGITEVVINLCYHAEQIKAALGNGDRYGMSFIYSLEQVRLETGGGILNALPLLGEDPFIVVSSDIITDYPLVNLLKAPKGLAHLVMVDNPSFHPHGDFGIKAGLANMDAQPTLTFANMGVYRQELFSQAKVSHFPLNQLLFPAIKQQQISAEHYLGKWFNVGTPEELALLTKRAREDSNL